MELQTPLGSQSPVDGPGPEHVPAPATLRSRHRALVARRLGWTAIVLTLVPPVGGSLGILTIMLGLRARRKADGDEPAEESAVFAVWIGLLAIALSVVMASLMVGMLADGVTELPGSETP